MKRLLWIILAAVILFRVPAYASPSASGDNQGVILTADDRNAEAASALACRILPRHGKEIEFILEPSEADFYSLETVDGHLRICGNNANSMAVGLGNYLEDFCKITVTWYERDAVREPRHLPAVEQKVTRSALVKHRFFLNYCTFGYTLAWWQWKDWERFIDWRAMHGITLALANTGQEAVWQRVWQKFGMTPEQCREYFTGPGYLPWHRMSNIDAWHGPLPQHWIDTQAAMQQQIVARELELGINPVLTSFNGHVPAMLRDLYPESDIKPLSAWGRFEKKYNCWYLNPADPLYDKIQKCFLAEQKALFGQDCHIYGVDPFNEVDPPSWEPKYLAEAGRRTYESLAESDPEAVWLQMGWLFYYDRHWTDELIKAYLTPVPKGRLLMIDYYCEKAEVYPRTGSFYGQDFIWSYLGNFGGNTMISGNFKDISAKLDRAYAEAGEGFVGIGATLEGLGVDPQVYEYVLDRAWEKTRTDEEWIDALADRHAGFTDTHNRAAWRILYEECHKQIAGNRGMIISCRPRMEGWNNWRNRGCNYDNHYLLEAWKELSSSRRSRSAAYRFDCANLARQCLENYFADLLQLALRQYESKAADSLKVTSARMLRVLDDIDRITGTDSYFLLGKWIADARAWGSTPEEEEYLERDARMLISCWGYRGAGLNDYANRSYNGLIKGFYRQRWEKFLDGLADSAAKGETFDYNAFQEWDKDLEWEWATADKSVFRATPKGNPVCLSRRLYRKYRSEIAASAGTAGLLDSGGVRRSVG